MSYFTPSELVKLRKLFKENGIVKIPIPSTSPGNTLFPTSSKMLDLADSILYTDSPTHVKTHETVNFYTKFHPSNDDNSNNTTQMHKINGQDYILNEKRVLTRVENFVNDFNPDWKELCGTGGFVSEVVSLICSGNTNTGHKNDASATSATDVELWCLYKEKLNLKPSGGAGFAPHLDMPSLRVTGLSGEFVTAMISIDDMTVKNGCLRVIERGDWGLDDEVELCGVDASVMSAGANPDNEGRRGAILASALPSLEDKWKNVECPGGSLYIFCGYIPHRSASNNTMKARRSVFLTYNDAREGGDMREEYYKRMADKRKAFLKANQVGFMEQP